MVLRTTLQLELPRRVVVYYLLFCLTTVVWLVLGAVMATRIVIHARSENSALSRLERVASQLEIAYLRSADRTNCRSLVEQIREERPIGLPGPGES